MFTKKQYNNQVFEIRWKMYSCVGARENSKLFQQEEDANAWMRKLQEDYKELYPDLSPITFEIKKISHQIY